MGYFKIYNWFQKLNIYAVIFLLTFIVGIIAIESNSKYVLNPDSTGYHNLAMDIIENGELNKFFREPGYPYFLATGYYLYSLIGGEPKHLKAEEYDAQEKIMLIYKPEIHFIKYFQLFFIIFSTMLFYATIKIYFSNTLSKCCAVTCSLYYPYIISCIYLLREPFLLFLTSLLSYLISRYLINRKLLYLLSASFIVGIGALTFQIYIAFLLVLLFAIIKSNKGFKNIVLSSIITIVILFITISYWCYKAYNCYPDIRVCRTVGSSLTYESVVYVFTIRKANENGIISEQQLFDLIQKNWYRLSDKDLFERSFNGWYINQSDSLNKLIKEPFSKRIINKIKLTGQYAKNAFIHKDFSHFNSHYELTFIKILLKGISVIVSILGFLGLLLIKKSDLVYLMPQSMFLLLFPLIGSENRRFLPALPLILFLFCYTVMKLSIQIKHRYASNNNNN